MRKSTVKLNRLLYLSLLGVALFQSCRKDVGNLETTTESRKSLTEAKTATAARMSVDEAEIGIDELNSFGGQPNVTDQDIRDDYSGEFYPVWTGNIPRIHLTSIPIIRPFTKRQTALAIYIYYEYVTEQILSNIRILQVRDAEYAKHFFTVDGPKLGEITDKQIFCNIGKSYGTTHEADFYGNCIEKRTVTYSLQGKMKILGGLKAGEISVGMELEAGFTVSSVYNDIGDYAFGGRINWQFGNNLFQPLVTYTFQGTFRGTQAD